MTDDIDQKDTLKNEILNRKIFEDGVLNAITNRISEKFIELQPRLGLEETTKPHRENQTWEVLKEEKNPFGQTGKDI